MTLDERRAPASPAPLSFAGFRLKDVNYDAF